MHTRSCSMTQAASEPECAVSSSGWSLMMQQEKKASISILPYIWSPLVIKLLEKQSNENYANNTLWDNSKPATFSVTGGLLFWCPEEGRLQFSSHEKTDCRQSSGAPTLLIPISIHPSSSNLYSVRACSYLSRKDTQLSRHWRIVQHTSALA